MEQKIEYIDDGRILVRKVRGKADFSEIYDSWVNIINNRKVSPDIIGIINDFHGAKLEMKITDVSKLISLFEEKNELFENKKIAVIVDNHKNIVFPMVGERIASKIKVRPFSTFDAAYKWINETG